MDSGDDSGGFGFQCSKILIIIIIIIIIIIMLDFGINFVVF